MTLCRLVISNGVFGNAGNSLAIRTQHITDLNDINTN